MRPGDVPGWPAEKALLSGVWLQFGAVQKQSWSHATGSAMHAGHLGVFACVELGRPAGEGGEPDLLGEQGLAQKRLACMREGKWPCWAKRWAAKLSLVACHWATFGLEIGPAKRL